MRFSILIICILFSTTSCYEQDVTPYHFDWAVVDTKLIEVQLLIIAKKQNPYPKEINIDIDLLETDSNQLSRQVNSLIRTAQKMCSSKKMSIEQSKTQELRIPASKAIMSRSTISPGMGSPNSSIETISRNECINNIDSDPLISDLKAKLDKFKNISKLQSKHDSTVRKAARTYSLILISEYSKDKFEIVIKSDRKNVLYNKSGLSIDITEAILNEMKFNEPQVLIQ